MKRVLVLIFVFLLAACGKTNETFSETTSPIDKEAPPVEFTPSPTEKPIPTDTVEPTNEAVVLSGVIAYFYEDPYEYGIYLVEPGSSRSPAILLAHTSGDMDPAWSPDGKQLAFSSRRNGHSDIYLVNLDGTGLTRLTEDPAIDISPVFSPDGKSIAFASNRSGDWNIFVMGSDGSNPVQLSSGTGGKDYPSWSPDGQQIAFQSDSDGDLEIYVVTLSDKTITQLTKNDIHDLEPSWSPDGNQIVYVSQGYQNWDLFVMNADGSEPVNITNSKSAERNPAWSPSGDQIVFTSDRNEKNDIFVVEKNGDHLLQITDSPEAESFPRWSPEGVTISDEPYIGPAWCARDADQDGWPEEPTSTFAAANDLPYVVFPYRNMKDGMDFANLWSFDKGGISPNVVSPWSGGESGVGYVYSIMYSGGSGKFTVQISVDNKMLQEVQCEIVE